jgi:GTPase SAR1 family protein
MSITPEILLLGGPQSGKSALVKRLRSHPHVVFSEPCTVATVGVEMFSVSITSSTQVTMREIGSSMSLRWQSYLDGCQAILFMVDASDTTSAATTLMLLFEVLGVRGSKPLAIYLNKADLCDEEAVMTMYNVLNLGEVLQEERDRGVTFIGSGSCLDDSAARTVREWLTINNSFKDTK